MRPAAIDRLMEAAVEDGVFPGAVLWARAGDDLAFAGAFGQRSREPRVAPMCDDTIFDVSSLTKACATSVALMQLVSRGSVGLDDTVAQHLPAFHGSEKAGITLRHLLSHASGLPAWRPYFDAVRRSPCTVAGAAARELVRAHASTTPPERPPGQAAVYSDVGFILLGDIVEAITGTSLDEHCRRHIFLPLGMSDTGFVDLSPAARRSSIAERAAATERCPWRGKVLCGEVHDDNAYAMGGVAGHAGLFSTARDLDLLLCHLRDAYTGRRHDAIVAPAVVRAFWQPARTAPDSDWRLGWDSPAAVGSSAGSGFSRNSVGHLGFTGVSIWLDLERERHVILLTNRVHPSRSNDAIRAFRPRIHDALVAALP